MQPKTCFILLLLLCGLRFTSYAHFNHTSVTAATVKPDSTLLDSLIKLKTFKLQGNGFYGDGWDAIKNELQKVQFVMIGEQHGMAEVPVFTGLVSDIFKPKALVAEIDPYTAADLKKVAPNPAGFTAYFKKYPYDLAFFSYRTELELARKMMHDKIDIWGLNEVNFLSIGHFFKNLATQARSPANIKLATQKAEQYERTDRLIFKDVNRYNDFSAYKIKVATVDSLIVAFKGENALSRKMLADLKTSIPIFANIDYKSRLNLMKKNLLNYLYSSFTRDTIKLPRLIFKFGANHLVSTNDRTGQYEVGNFADQLAGTAGQKTLHILIFGKNGTVNEMAPVDNAKAIQPYSAEEGTFKSFKPFYKNIKADEWGCIDLRPIKRAILDGKFPVMDETLHDFILGNDMMVIFGSAHGNAFVE